MIPAASSPHQAAYAQLTPYRRAGICGCWVGAASFNSRNVTHGTRCTLHPLARYRLFADCHPGLDPGPTHQCWKALDRRDMSRRAPPVIVEKWVPDRLFAVRDDRGMNGRRMNPLTASPSGMTPLGAPKGGCCLYPDCHPGLDPGPTHQRWKALDRRDMSRRAPPPVVVEKQDHRIGSSPSGMTEDRKGGRWIARRSSP